MSERYSIAALVRRLTLVIARGRISQSDDSGVIQTLQVPLTPLETPNLKRVAEFGLASWPPDGTDAIAVFIAGDRSNGVVLGTHNLKARMKMLHKGEAALHDASGPGGAPGKWVWLKLAGGGIEIEAHGEPIVINHASAITVNPPAGGATAVTLNTGGGNITLNLGGGNVTLNNPGAVVLGPAGKKVVVDGDPVIGGGGGTVQASQNVVKA